MPLNTQLPLLRQRPRRLRASVAIRDLVREHRVHRDDLILPIFVSEKISGKTPVASMPGIFQYGLDGLQRELASISEDKIPGVLLFGIPQEKDENAAQAYAEDGIVQRALGLIKKEAPHLVKITDVCLCEYMSHGHCGILKNDAVDNDETLELLALTAVSHAQAGADIVAPSDMMDGRVAAIRSELDAANFPNTIIMSYAAKFCSAFYGPFREAAESAPKSGDRRGYQLDPANALEALREAKLDLEEAADILMVKPALPYLDVLWRIKERFEMPTAVYNVSGEYAMLKAAAEKGWIDERAAVMETVTAFKRAGADLIITYWARDVARWLNFE